MDDELQDNDNLLQFSIHVDARIPKIARFCPRIDQLCPIAKEMVIYFIYCHPWMHHVIHICHYLSHGLSVLSNTQLKEMNNS